MKQFIFVSSLIELTSLYLIIVNFFFFKNAHRFLPIKPLYHDITILRFFIVMILNI